MAATPAAARNPTGAAVSWGAYMEDWSATAMCGVAHEIWDQLTKASEEELEALPVPVAEFRALEAALETEPAALEAELRALDAAPDAEPRALEAALEAEAAPLERELETEPTALEAELPAPPAKIVVAAELVIVEPSEVTVVRKVEVVMAEPAEPLPVADS